MTDPAKSAPVTMYTSSGCGYCTMAEQLLHARGVEVIDKIRVDLDPAQRRQMMARTGRRTVPQIYIGSKHIGGYTELSALDRAGKLMPLLRIVE